MPVTINGSAGVTTNSGAVYNGLQTDTAKASTSGTSVDFTGIPSWVKRVTVMFSGVSTNGVSNGLVQLGAGSITNSGYLGSAAGYQATNSGACVTYTTGFGIATGAAANTLNGHMILTNVSGNTWASSHNISTSTSNIAFFGSGVITLSGTLDRVRITTVNGTDTFDAGTINIIYE